MSKMNSQVKHDQLFFWRWIWYILTSLENFRNESLFSNENGYLWPVIYLKMNLIYFKDSSKNLSCYVMITHYAINLMCNICQFGRFILKLITYFVLYFKWDTQMSDCQYVAYIFVIILNYMTNKVLLASQVISCSVFKLV